MEFYKNNELTKEAKALTFAVIAKVNAEQIENIIVDALECQSNYWVGLDNTTKERDNAPDDLPASQYATQLILEGNTVRLYDIEDDSEVWDLNLQKLLAGIGKAISEGLDLDDDADAVLQYALFDEIVYG